MRSRKRTAWAIFCTLWREEWRLHTRLFGGWRFTLFPLVIAALAVAGSIALAETGTSSARIVAGGHLFALVFGLYSGTAGFAGTDMLENVFGRLSLVLSTPRTLPLSRRRLLGLFLLKDALFYALAFVLPMALAIVPFVGLSTRTPLEVLTLWLSLSLAFGLGMLITVVVIAASTRGVPGWIGGLTLGGAVFTLWVMDTADSFLAVLVAYEHSFLVTGGVVLLGLGAGVLALIAYDPTAGSPSRAAGDRFARLEDALPVGESGLVSKTLLDLSRSSGGVLKPIVSVVILFGLVAFLVGVVAEITGIEPAPGIFFGGILGLSAFTTYNWLTQFDSVEEYLAYPVSVEAVFRAKRTAFILVGAPAAALPYLGALLWFEATGLDALVGAVLLAGYGLYYYGLTVYIAGFDPNEFLFDALRFTAFTLGVAVALVPTLVVGFVVVPPSPDIALALSISGLVFGGIGLTLSSRAGPRWADHYRTN